MGLLIHMYRITTSQEFDHIQISVFCSLKGKSIHVKSNSVFNLKSKFYSTCPYWQICSICYFTQCNAVYPETKSLCFASLGSSFSIFARA